MPERLSWSVDGADWPNREASRFVDAAGYRWHVQVMGEGPVAVLAHGTGASSHSWRSLAPLLSRHFTIVAPDLPGHGFTEAPSMRRLSLPGMARDLAELLRTLGMPPAVGIGHSAGAAILARMTIDRMIAPRLLVSLNGAFLPFPGIVASILSPLARMMALNPLVPLLFAWRGRDPAAVHQLIAGTGSAIDAQGERLYGRLVASRGHVAAALQMMANWELQPLVDDLPRLGTPLLLVAAVGDTSVPPEVARRVKALVPHAELELVAGCGHLAHEEKPQRIDRLVTEAAARLGLIAPQQQAST